MYFCVSGGSILPFSFLLIFDFGIVPTMWYLKKKNRFYLHIIEEDFKLIIVVIKVGSSYNISVKR